MGAKQSTNEMGETVPLSSLSAWKNLIVVSLGFFLLFTSYMSAQNLQSSLNSAQGLGVASLSVIYGALIIGCFFLPNIVIKYLGLKKTMACAMSLYSLYFLANFLPTFYTMMPTAILLGLGGSVLWPAKCSYLAVLAGPGQENKLSTYFGVFFGIFQCAQISGNVISYLVLKPPVEVETVETDNKTQNWTCGAGFCDWEWTGLGGSTARPEESQIRLLFGVYTGGAVLAVILLALCLLDLEDDKKDEEPTTVLLRKSMVHLGDPRQLLMIPITIYSGLQQAYIFSDYTKAFVTCDWGVHSVGYVMICFGACNAGCCFALGPLSRVVGRPILMALATLLQLACTTAMLLLNGTGLNVLFIIAGLWGAADAVWQSQINTHYGILFADRRKEGFAHYRLWESIGFILAFIYSPYLCIKIQLYILLVYLILGYACYLPTALKPKLVWPCRESKTNQGA